MLNRIFVTVALSSLLASLLTTIGFFPKLNEPMAIAQVPIEETKPVISPEKKALIKELLEITGSGKNAAQIMDAMVRSELPKLVSTVLKAVPALDSDRPEVQKQFGEIVSRMAVKYRDRVIQKIDINQLLEQVSYPVYDKYFTESELRDIISFYKSETGKKAIGIMPQIIGDSMRRTNEVLLPQMSKIMTEVITEELLNALPNKK